MDHEIKEPPPLSSTLCSQPSQFSQNTQETYPRYFQQDLNERKKKGTCFTCGQKDHWYRECPFKSSNNDSQNANSIWCRCGHGRCEKRTSKSEKNPGRMYYVCPIKRGEKCTNGFVKWCDDPDVESDWSQPPPFKYPECKCPAGVCKREKATHNGVVKYYFTCPVKEGHGNCGYKVWEDELLHKRTNDQDDHDFDEGVNLAVNHSKKMRIMDSSEEDPTPMAVSEAELSQSEDEALEKASQLSCLSESTPSRIGGDRQHVFPRHIFAGAGAGAGADPSFEMSASSPSQAKEQDDDTKPLWTYVTKIKSVGGGGNYEIKCNICDFTFNGSYTRVRAHLLKMTGKGVRVCQKVTIDRLIDLKKIDNEATLRVEKSKTKSVSLPPISTQHQMDTNTLGVDPKKKKTSTIENAFNLQARETLDHEIARMFYSSGLPFHLARNPHYRKAFAYAANNQISGYQPPGYNKLRTTLLQNERRHVENLLQPIKNAWSQKGVSIVSDGWSDPQRRSLINFMAVTESGPMFLKAIDCSNEIKDKDFIAKLMREVIMEVGHSNVVQIVTDNAAVCKAASLIIEAEFPSIYWTPCVVHTLNLALKNICAAKNTEKNNFIYEECSWITQIADDAMFVKNFVTSHSMRLSIFNSFNSLKLLSIAPTRFASTIVMLKRFKQLKKGLQEMVISDQWSSYKEDDVAKAKFVKDTLLDDKWWDKVDYILSFTSPIYDVLRRTDTEASSLHLVYEMWDSMIEKVKNAIYQYERKEESEGSTFYEVVHSILIDRWTKSSTPLHCLAHSLNPRYYSHEWLSEDSNRVPPHQDLELTRERLKCFKRFFLDMDVRRKVNIEFANFSDGREGFDDLNSLNDRGQMDPKAWWLVHGINAPILQKVALKLLAQPCSSSCCERNWSTYSFIHSLKRNKMAPHRAEDLVFVHSNLRLLSRNTPQYHQEETKMWDVAGDDFGSLNDCGILEIASLSLDEPELESVFFNDDC